MISFDPFLRVDVGPLEVSPHGVFTAIGLLAGVWAALPHLRSRGVADEQVFEIVTPAVVTAVVGARLFYVLNHLGDFGSLGEVVAVWEGGLSLLGGLIPALVVAVVLLRRRRLPVLTLLDGAAPGFAVGITVGRIGDVLIADHLGKPTDFFLGYVCPGSETGSPCVAPVGEAVHLTALYDLVAAALIGVVLFGLVRRVGAIRPGTAFLTFAGLYSVARFLEGFARLDETHGTGLSGSQWASVAVLAGVASAGMALARTPRHGTPVHQGGTFT